MTKEEAEAITNFEEYCTCGGYAWSTNGRPHSDPHMPWCPQKPQYDEWWKAMYGADAKESIEVL
jgi:hypothetical protein